MLRPPRSPERGSPVSRFSFERGGAAVVIFRAVACRIGLAAAILLAAFPVAYAQEGAQREALLKAAFLYNFAKFTEWPKERPDADSGPVLFCIGQNSRLKAAIDELQGKLVGSRPVRTVVLTEGVNPMTCHVLFIDDSVPARVRQLAESDLHGVLTVSDLPNFARTGGNIGLFFADNQLRFQINLDTARRSGIAFSSKLLRLADVIGQQSSLPTRFAAALRLVIDWM